MDEDVPLLIPEINAGFDRSPRAAAAGARLERRDRHQRELLDDRPRDRARSAPRRLRSRAGLRHDDAGRLGRRLPGRSLARHPRQRAPRHSGGSREDRAGDAQDPRAELSGDAVRPADFVVSAMTYRVPVEDGHTESVSVELRPQGFRGRGHRRVGAVPRAGETSRRFPPRRRTPSSTSPSRSVRSRGATSTRRAAWRPSSGP